MDKIKSIPRTAEDIITKIGERKEQTKKKVRDYFNTIKRELDQKESAIVCAIENTQAGEDKLGGIIHDAKIITENVENTLLTGNTFLCEWRGENITPKEIENAISFIKEVERVERFKEDFEELSFYEVSMELNQIEDDAKRIIQEINAIKEVPLIERHFGEQKAISANIVGPFYVVINWGEREKVDKYIITLDKEKGSKKEHILKTELTGNTFTKANLEEKTSYIFKVLSVQEGGTTKLQNLLRFKTTPFIERELDSIIDAHRGNIEICMGALRKLEKIIEISKKNVYFSFVYFVYSQFL